MPPALHRFHWQYTQPQSAVSLIPQNLPLLPPPAGLQRERWLLWPGSLPFQEPPAGTPGLTRYSALSLCRYSALPPPGLLPPRYLPGSHRKQKLPGLLWPPSRSLHRQRLRQWHHPPAESGNSSLPSTCQPSRFYPVLPHRYSA